MAKITRESHIHRFYDEAGGAWIDLQVLDKVTIKSGRGSAFVKTVIKFDYEGDEDPDDPKLTRKIETLKIYNPNDDKHFIPIKITTSIKTTAGRGSAFVRRIRTFENDPEATSVRKRHVKRVIHYGIDDKYLTPQPPQPQGQPIDPNWESKKQPPRTVEDYLDAVEKTNAPNVDNYVDTEVIEKYSRKHGRGHVFEFIVFELAWNDDPLMQEQTKQETRETARVLSDLGPSID